MNLDKFISKRTIYPNVYVSLFIALAAAIIIALTGALGHPYLLIGVLVIISLPALFYPLIIPVSVIIIAPLLGQTTTYTIGPLNGIGILSMWFLALGSVIVLIKIEKLLRYKLIIVAFLLIGLALLSIVPSNNKTNTNAEVLRIASAMLMLPIVVILGRQLRDRKIIITAILLSSVVPIFVGIYQKVTGDLIIGGAVLTNYEVETGLIRIYSTFYDAHPFAKYLVVLLSLSFALFIEERKSILAKLIYISLFVTGFLNLIFTYARGQLISVLISCAIILFAAGKLKLKFAFIFIPILIGLFAGTGVFDRFSDLVQPSGATVGVQVNSLEFRLDLWERAIPLSLQSPILGHGAGTFESALGIIAHNDYLGFFYEFGIGGLILYIMFLILAGWVAWKYILNVDKSGFDRTIALAGLGATVAIAVSSVAENIFSSTTMWWIYMAILGCVLIARREQESIQRSMQITE
jgi:O-antigen ligase